MEMKAMPTAMGTLLDVKDWIVNELEHLEKAQKTMNDIGMGDYFRTTSKWEKLFLITTYNMLPDEVEEGVIKKEGEEEWHEK